jgi:hypothetical protein
LQLDLEHRGAQPRYCLYGRVLDYQSDYLYDVCYQQRRFLITAGIVHLPHARAAILAAGDEPMKCTTADNLRAEHLETVVQVRQALAENVRWATAIFRQSPRQQLPMHGHSIALYYLWLTGDMMIHHRGLRAHDAAAAPPELDYTAPVEQPKPTLRKPSLLDWRFG